MKFADLEALTANARAQIRPYRWIVEQSTCRACGNVHESKPVLMREHAPGSWIVVWDEIMISQHMDAPVQFQPKALAWCEACHSKAAQELTRSVREAVDKFSNTNQLAVRLEQVLQDYNTAHTRERFHHGASV